jgi:hypothetical protein
MTEEYGVFKALQQERAKEGAARRNASKEHYALARQFAAQADMTLTQHTEIHYSLQSPAGWILNIYPGNRRLYHDRNCPKPPFLKIKPDWTLIDVVQAAIVASGSINTEAFAAEIEKKAQKVTNEQIQVRAYHLWDAAGRPEGDGQHFWHLAEKEMRGK